MFKKSLPIGTLLILALIAVASLGVAYGAWSASLKVDGTVSMGDFNARFTSIVLDINNKAAGECVKTSAEGYNAAFAIKNAVPGFTCKVTWVVENNGSVPWRILMPQYTLSPTPAQLEVVQTESLFPKKCTQVEPGKTVTGFFTLKVLQTATIKGAAKAALAFDVQNFLDECTP